MPLSIHLHLSELSASTSLSSRQPIIGRGEKKNLSLWFLNNYLTHIVLVKSTNAYELINAYICVRHRAIDRCSRKIGNCSELSAETVMFLAPDWKRESSLKTKSFFYGWFSLLLLEAIVPCTSLFPLPSPPKKTYSSSVEDASVAQTATNTQEKKIAHPQSKPSRLVGRAGTNHHFPNCVGLGALPSTDLPLKMRERSSGH